MKLVVATAIILFGSTAGGQAQVISPTTEFDLNAGFKPRHIGKYSRLVFAVTPGGMTLVTIGESSVALETADLHGRMVHVRTDLASVHARIYGALPRPDGCMWLLSNGPSGLWENAVAASSLGSASPVSLATGQSGPGTNFTQMDLYSPDGEHLEAVRLLASVAGAETPIAAANSQLALRTEVMSGGSGSRQTVLHFGSTASGNFSEQTQVKLVPAVRWGISLMTPNGDLVLIDKGSGNRIEVDPKSKNGRLVRLATPSLVKAAAADAEFVYLLTGDRVLKTDSAGRVLATYQLQFSRGFVPVALGVTGNALFLVDRTGHGERFDAAE